MNRERRAKHLDNFHGDYLSELERSERVLRELTGGYEVYFVSPLSLDVCPASKLSWETCEARELARWN
jgi:hypothetical protein